MADQDADRAPRAGEVDPHELVDLLERFLLGSEPTMTGPALAERAGIPFEQARARWRSLGFTSVPEDEIAFTDADLHAIELTERLRALGIADADTEASLIRTMGRSFSRLAEWQLDLLAKSIDLETISVDDLGALMEEITPLIEDVSRYVWRRHTLNAASRMLLAQSDGGEATSVVGFADIVGYTRQSRSLHQDELIRLVDDFEAHALQIITEHGGRIIKTIGDEVLYVAEDPYEAALIGLELTEGAVRFDSFPELRVGMSFGPVVARLGDVFGPVVNLASRLTSSARPGRVLIDREMADALRDRDDLRLRKLRRTSVKGYRHLEPWLLRRPYGEDPDFDAENLPGPASGFISEHGRDLVRTIEQGHRGGAAEEGTRERPDR